MPNDVVHLASDEAASVPAGAGAAIQLRGISKRYGAFTAIDKLDLDIEGGEFVSLLGPSGSGKTTTLMLMAGFERPDSGRMTLGGNDVTDLAPHRRGLGMVFQSYALFPHMTVSENVGFALKQRGIRGAVRMRRVQGALDLVRLPEHSGRYPQQLSGGQQQRVAIARALVFDPPVLLMDEPPERARQAVARRDAVRDQAPARSAGHHLRLCHARPAGGADHVGPGGGDGPWPGHAGGHAGAPV